MVTRHPAGRAFRPGWWAGGLNLAERQAAAGKDLERPDWAEFVELVLGTPAGGDDRNGLDGGGDGEGGEGGGSAPWLDAFAAPLRPLTEETGRRIAAAFAGLSAGPADRPAGAADLPYGNADLPAGAVDLPAVCADVTAWLSARLARTAARTFVLELDRARTAGQLRGETPERRFADFTRQLGAGALPGVLQRYPVLARLLGQACLRAVDAAAELLARFAADRGAIVAGLLGGTDPGPLTGLDCARGDLHRGGRSVTFLRFASGATVVYKPRGLAAQDQFAALVGWLDGKVPGLSLRTPATVARPGYGWMQLVTHRPCANPAQVDRFYRRQGALLALLYALDGGDIHYENVIARGDQPMLVDVETLFQPDLTAARVVPDPAAAALQSSVLRTALLPQLLFGRHGAFDVSGLGGDRGAAFPISAAGWEAAGTDRMRLVRRPAAVAGADNRPRLAGRGARAAETGGDTEVAEAAEHRAALLGGFRAGYRAIAAHPRELSALLESAGCAGSEIRVLVRPTQTYATLLAEATHPDVLADGLERERVFDTLRASAAGDPVRLRLVPHELAQLWAGDVPIFVTTPGSTDLVDAAGERLPSLLAGSGLAAATRKIAAMGDADLRRQEWLVDAALAVRAGPVEHRSGEPARRPKGPARAGGWSAEPLLAAACRIGDELAGSAARGAGRVNWAGLERPDERHWAVLPMGAGLADGYPGVALFLAQLAALTGSDRYAGVAMAAVAPLPRLVEHLAARPELAAAVGPGAFHGLGGICYALARLSRLLGGAELAGCLAAAVDLAAGVERAAADLDAVAASGDGGELARHAGLDTGVAGGLAALTAVGVETGLPAARRLASRYAERLLAWRGAGALPPGFATGRAGAGWALLRHAASGAGERCAERGRELAMPPPVNPAAQEPHNHAWCSGLAGTLLAEAAASAPPAGTTRHATPTGCPPELARRAAALAAGQPLRDSSLCHGEAGVLDTLAALADRGVQPAAGALARRGGRLLRAAEAGAHRCGTPGGVPTPGLLSGLAGIGYALLRLGFAAEVPSVLTLETAGGKNGAQRDHRDQRDHREQGMERQHAG